MMEDPDDLALEIESYFSAATENTCSCGSDPEGYCRYCGAWADALRKTARRLREALEAA